MTEQLNQRTKKITIERPLIPSPPKDAEPYWCYINTLIFYENIAELGSPFKHKRGKEIWRQEIPEADIFSSQKGEHYFWPVKVFWEDDFGWQLRIELSHEKADYWLSQMMNYLGKRIEPEEKSK